MTDSQRHPPGRKPPDGNYPYGLQNKPEFNVPAVTYYFRSRQNAQKAVELLAQAGFTKTDIDRISAAGPTSDLPSNSVPSSLGAGDSSSERIVSAANPAVSGMAGGTLLGSAPYLVTVLVDSAQQRQEVVGLLDEFKKDHPEGRLGEPPLAHGR